MLRYQWLMGGSRTVEVTGWHSAIFQWFRREQILRVSVFLNEYLQHGPQDLGPDFTDSMNTPIPGIVKNLICRGVDGVVLHDKGQNAIREVKKGGKYQRVDVVSDTGLTVGSPCTHSIVRVRLRTADGGGQEVFINVSSAHRGPTWSRKDNEPPQPSPMPPGSPHPRHPEFAGPPVKRVLKP